MRDLLVAFGRSEALERIRGRFDTLATLDREEVRRLLREYPVVPCFDARYTPLVKRLRRRCGVRLPVSHRVRAIPKRGDEVLIVWVEPPTRPFLLDPCEYDVEEVTPEDLFFTVEEVV